MSIDRTIVYARCADGRVGHQFACRVRIDGDSAVVGDCELASDDLDEAARARWHQFAQRLPQERRRQLVAEAGMVREGDVCRGYAVAHANGALLDGLGARFAMPECPNTVGWCEVSENVPLVFGPSAVLALADFTLDGLPGKQHQWPFPSELRIEDTSRSPYPPQHRDDPAPLPIEPDLRTSAAPEDTTFLLLQRSERWQRPINALYNVRQRNLAIAWSGSADEPARAAVIDTLTAESEPTLASSAWLATWYLRDPAGDRWGRERLALAMRSADVLHAVTAAAGPSRPACICDPIEGEAYGMAPPLQVPRSVVSLQVLSP